MALHGAAQLFQTPFCSGQHQQHRALTRSAPRRSTKPRGWSSNPPDEVQPNKRIVRFANAFAHESGIPRTGVLKKPPHYEIIDARTIGLSDTGSPLGKLSGPQAPYRPGWEELRAYLSRRPDLAAKPLPASRKLGRSQRGHATGPPDLEANRHANRPSNRSRVFTLKLVQVEHRQQTAAHRHGHPGGWRWR